MSELGTRTPSGDVNRHETRDLIASDKVAGTTVYNHQKENLGRIHNFMIDKISGRVDYAVLSFGGILGIGNMYYPIPWGHLKYDTSLGGFVVDIDHDQLEGAPAFAERDEDYWADPTFGRRIDDFYGPNRIL